MNTRGFTLIELLVASMLLAMLISILTMLFNQSSIAWRTGMASVNSLKDVRENIAEVREEADNAYLWNGKVERIVGLWDDSGRLRNRAWSAGGAVDGSGTEATYLKSAGVSGQNAKLSDFSILSVGAGSAAGRIKTYTVNVKSAGPDREFNTFDDIWSYPDEISF